MSVFVVAAMPVFVVVMCQLVTVVIAGDQVGRTEDADQLMLRMDPQSDRRRNAHQDACNINVGCEDGSHAQNAPECQREPFVLRIVAADGHRTDRNHDVQGKLV
mmetsp:Transcript_49654/g.124555  ORF Transcript_49654/g.124555 Transcript_49654/m.124555 type:complete len:104 (+) Transcript_49654:262-573(+)